MIIKKILNGRYTGRHTIRDNDFLHVKPFNFQSALVAYAAIILTNEINRFIVFISFTYVTYVGRA